MTDKPTLSPATLDLPPRERLKALRDWLRDGELPEDGIWDYSIWHILIECDTIACAGGWYDHLTQSQNAKMEAEEHFDISIEQSKAIFHSANEWLPDTVCTYKVTGTQVADIIDRVLAGEKFDD